VGLNRCPRYYLPENRTKKITNLVAKKNDWKRGYTQKLVRDFVSEVNPLLLK